MFDWLTDLYEWITGLPSRLLDAILRPAADYIDTLSPVSSTPAHFFAGIGNDVMQLATLIGLPEAMAILAVAYTTRFLLQLIPFIRLGS